MEIIRLFELVLGLMIAVLGVAKAYMELRIVRSKQKREKNESGDADQANPRS